ncbi:hypothetical protein MHT86_04355 [Corynebacterium mastitidis]|uniref:Uncharacterized protein n=1 Tax=Corynebacterium mastitidis TaxID=161890 RepID=A0A2N0X5H2_9CORY|nr:hypothetical protein [Corynebacterium mastitidis]MCH6196732.1 hypothetical protein [Corynebacterium mastitidis]PKF67954.1 hypothetical protein CXB45_09520 [Corynebacterium mastitidis]
MPQIQFDVLIPDDRAERLRAAFDAAADKLRSSGRARGAEASFDPDPAVPAEVVEQLREIFREEHEGRDLEGARVRRYTLDVDGLEGSVNELTMSLSRMLTPPAELPQDPVLLANEAAHERPARYPWTVEVRR